MTPTETCPVCGRPCTIVRGVCSECGALVKGNPPAESDYRPNFFRELLDDLLWWAGLTGRR